MVRVKRWHERAPRRLRGSRTRGEVTGECGCGRSARTAVLAAHHPRLCAAVRLLPRWTSQDTSAEWGVGAPHMAATKERRCRCCECERHGFRMRDMGDVRAVDHCHRPVMPDTGDYAEMVMLCDKL